MTTLQEGSLQTSRRRVARAVTDLFAPVNLVVGNLVLVGASSTRRPLVGASWGLLAATFAGLLPYAFVLLGVRRGRYTDRHVRLRQQRRAPLMFAAGCVVVGMTVLSSLGAPRQLLALVIAMLVGLVVTLTITHWWKISIHSAVAGGSAVILSLAFGPALLLVLPVVVAVCWSRVALGDHTPAQVLGGAGVGCLVAAIVFTSLR